MQTVGSGQVILRPAIGDERGSDSPGPAIAFRENDRTDRSRADDAYGDARVARTAKTDHSLVTDGSALTEPATRPRS